MTARGVVLEYLRGKKQVTSREIAELLREHRYALCTANWVIRELRWLGVLRTVARNRRGVAVYEVNSDALEELLSGGEG